MTLHLGLKRETGIYSVFGVVYPYRIHTGMIRIPVLVRTGPGTLACESHFLYVTPINSIIAI